MNRRSFFLGATAAAVSVPLAAPAIVRAASLMKVFAPKIVIRNDYMLTIDQYVREVLNPAVERYSLDQLAFTTNIFPQIDESFAMSTSHIGKRLRIRLPPDYRIA